MNHVFAAIVEPAAFDAQIAVLRAAFKIGDPEAMAMATRIRRMHAARAAEIERGHHSHRVADAAAHRRCAKEIAALIRKEYPHWTPRVDREHDIPTPEMAARYGFTPQEQRQTRKRHDPIRDLYERGRLTLSQKNAAIRIAKVFEEISSLSNFKPRNLEAGLGGAPRNSGRKPVAMRDDIAIDHRLVYKPWAVAVDSNPATGPLELIIDITVDCRSLRQCEARYRMDRRWIVERLRKALDLYAAIDRAAAKDDLYAAMGLEAMAG